MTERVRGGLLLYHRPLRGDASTIEEHIDSFGSHSAFPFWKLNTDLGFPRRLADLSFDVVVLHYTLFASGPHDYLLGPGFADWLDRSERTYKVAFFQDEHQYCRRRFAFCDRHGIDCVYSCYEPGQFDDTYGRYTSVPTIVSHVPAYVSDAMLARAEALAAPDSEREIDVGYRARPMPPYVGRGGLEKVEIGDRFNELAAGAGLELDISTAEEDRLYGDRWYGFLARCRGQLGTESGVSCSDLEDEVRTEYEALVEAGEEASLERLERGALGRWDWRVPLRTTSSRHFEAAAFRVCQIMFEGRYSGDLEPTRHYIPLRKDFSNLDEVLERFRDPELRREMTETSHRELIASGAHSYGNFIAGFDETLRQAGLEPPAERTEAALVKRVVSRRPVGRLAYRWAADRWERLHVTSPGISKLVHWATRPVVVPARKLAERRARRASG